MEWLSICAGYVPGLPSAEEASLKVLKIAGVVLAFIATAPICVFIGTNMGNIGYHLVRLMPESWPRVLERFFVL